MKYLLTCSGNTCRSPMAEALLRRRLGSGDEVRSAGVSANEDSPMARNAVQALEEIGIAFKKRSEQLSVNLVNWAEIILCVEARHASSILIDFPMAADKTYSLAAWAGETGTEIPDPIGAPIEEYRRTRDLLDRLLSQGLARRK